MRICPLPKQVKHIRAIRINTRSGWAIASPNLLGYPRLRILTPKKQFPRAVDRNRVRRRLKHAISQELDSTIGIDLIIHPSSKAIATSWIELTSDISQICQS